MTSGFWFTPAGRFARLTGLFLALAPAVAPQGFAPTPEVYRALARVSPDSLRGHLSFLASRLLEGRGTPSRGLNLAAEYIAAQFRRAGLEPAGDDGYFQTAQMLRAGAASEGVELRLREGGHVLTVPGDQVVVISRRPLELSDATVDNLRDADSRTVDLNGKVALLEADHSHNAAKIAALQPAAFLEVANDERPAPRLIDPDEEQAAYGGVPRIIVTDDRAAKMLKEVHAGLTLSIKLPEPATATVKVRNVVGVLRGSDPVLRNQCVLLSAHYDHLGRRGLDKIFPGANDDGSGTVSVVEIGQTLAGMPVHPRRSIVFAAFFGEEEGDLGSHYYAAHPVFPLEETVANLNLEQLGRTDSNSGPEVSNATLTGFGFSSVAQTLQEAGALTGVKVYETPGGDQFFERSDNQTFAERGIPAHTIVVAFEYPDYHRVGDTWQKIDYDNMAKVDRMIALGTIMLANADGVPQWNRENPGVGKYLKAR